MGCNPRGMGWTAKEEYVKREDTLKNGQLLVKLDDAVRLAQEMLKTHGYAETFITARKIYGKRE
jgi:hypothetical protein